MFKGIPGNVGIGTSSPGTPFEVAAASSAGASTVARFRHDNGADQHYLDVSVNPDTDTVKFISSGSANGSLVLGTQAVDTLTTTSAGRVGIGTASPAYALDIVGSPGVGLQIFETTSANTRRLRITQESIGVTYDATFGTGDNAHRWLVGGSERARIDSSGNVGIGTTSPGVPLEVFGGNARVALASGSSATFRGYEFASATTVFGSIKAESAGGELRIESGFATFGGYQTFYTNGSERARIDSSGRLGIGTTSPSSGLHLANATAGSAANFTLSNPANNWSIRTGTTENALVFVENQFASEKVRIDSSGRLGIGTSSPSHKLDVAGGVNSTGLNATGTGGFFNSASKFGVDNNGGVTRMYSSGPDASTRGSFDFRTTDSVGTLDTSRMVIDSSGNVGIGTSSPTGLLTVATATAGTAADFVIGNPANLWSIKTGTTTNALTIVDTQFSVERLRIDSSGRLLVGTSSDSGGALLQVNGDRIRVGTAKTPASASATGTTGEICWDANYIYVCTATNTWKRTAIATW